MSKTRIVDVTEIFSQSGIYIWKCDDIFVYIGTSKNMFSRAGAKDHVLALIPEFPNSSLKFYLIEDETRRKKLEAALIKRYKPILNIAGNPRAKTRVPKGFGVINKRQSNYTRRDYLGYQQYGKVF